VRLTELSFLSSSDSDKGFTTIRNIFHVCSYTWLGMVILFLIRGVSIISDVFTRRVAGESFLASLFFVVTLLEIREWDDFSVGVQCFLFALGFVCYTAEIYVAAQASGERLSALLVSDDPLASPSIQKYDQLKPVLLAIVVILFVNVFFDLIVAVDAWIQELFASVSEFVLVCGFVWFYRNRPDPVYGRVWESGDTQLHLGDEDTETPRASPVQPLLDENQTSILMSHDGS